jgi:hypothetical protein
VGFIFLPYICTNKQIEIMKLLQKKTRFFRGEAIGTDFLFDTDIEVFVDESNDIADYSGCGYETAKELLKTL